jgi:hypothetical protein
MAKKTAEEQYQAFLAEVVAAVPAGKREALEGILKDPEVTPTIRDRVLARSDYSRSMDEGRAELATARTALDKEITEARTRIKGWEDWYNTTSQEHAALQERVKTYEETYGEIDEDTPPAKNGKRGKVLDEETLAAELHRRDQLAIKFADVLTDLKIDHRERFKERLDTDALIKFAGEKGLPLDAAYNAFTADKVEAQRKTEQEAALKAAREEGARDALSKHHLPTSPTHNEPHVLDRTADVKTDARERVAAASTHFLTTRTTGAQ